MRPRARYRQDDFSQSRPEAHALSEQPGANYCKRKYLSRYLQVFDK